MNAKKYRRAAGLFAGTFLLSCCGILQMPVSAEEIYLRGDLDGDGILTARDLSQMKAVIAAGQPAYGITAGICDLDADGAVTAADARMLGDYLACRIDRFSADAWFSYTPPEQPAADFIAPPVKAHGASLPSAGDACLVIFYVDFPDCRYDYAPSEAELDAIAFGAADESNAYYPFESCTAFYARASKGNMKLRGKAFRYTTKQNRAVYDTDKVKIAEECYNAFSDSVDFSQFDGDGDGRIDATLFTVPTAAGNDDWWPCAGAFGDPYYQVDGKTIGHIITGNAQIESPTNYQNFVSSYCHEMGHCTGMPDYYLYGGGDSEGMHGKAGIELMDTDAVSDFGALSKLMLGFYREDQVQIYDASCGAQTFTLYNAQTDQGNCIIIPYGDLAENYFSEYFILEYATNTGNNSGADRFAWWVQTSNGVRVYHADATTEYGWWTYFRYSSGSEYTNNDQGRRMIRIIDDSGDDSYDNFYRAGDVIDGRISGFHWYDANGQQTVETGLQISVDAFDGDSYTVTVSPK